MPKGKGEVGYPALCWKGQQILLEDGTGNSGLIREGEWDYIIIVIIIIIITIIVSC